MILQNLNLKNFKQYREQDIALQEGLIGIIGKNGAGKSSIFEAILLALYGDIPFTKDYLRSSSAGDKEPVSVILDFEIDSKAYRVTREFRGKNLTPYGELCRGGEVIASGQTDVTSEIIRLLGLTRDAFTRSIFSGQKELGAISTARGAERRLLVRKMVGMERIDIIQQRIREDRNVLKNQVSGQEKLLFSGDVIKTKENALDNLSKKIENFKTEIEDINSRYNKALEQYEKAKTDFSNQQKLYREFSLVNTKMVKNREILKNLDNSLIKNKTKLKDLNESKKELMTLEAHEREFEILRKNIEVMEEQKNQRIKLDGLAVQVQALNKEIPLLNNELKIETDHIDKLTVLGYDINKNKEKLQAIDNQLEAETKIVIETEATLGKIKQLIKDRKDSAVKIKEVGKESLCPTCRRPLKDSFEQTLHQLEYDIKKYNDEDMAENKKKLDELKKNISRLKNERKDLQDTLINLSNKQEEKKHRQKTVERINRELNENNSKLNRLDKEIVSLGKLDYDEKKHQEAREHLKLLERKHEIFVALSERIKDIPVIEKEVLKNENEKKRAEKTINDISEELKSIPYSEKEYLQAEKKQFESEKEKDNYREQAEKKKEEFRTIEHRLKEIEKELKQDKKLRTTIEKAKKQFLSLNKLDKFMDDFKGAVLDRLRPVIAENASKLFQQITMGRYEAIEVDYDFNFLIMDEGQFYPIQRFSGGEEDLANLCLRLAISRVICDLSGGGSVGFLGFDEILGSQDNERRYEILRAFHMLKEIYRQIFIISHIDEIKEEFPLLLEISRNHSGSIVKWVDNSQ